MKNYELLTVFKPSLDSEELDSVIEKFSEEIKSYKGSVESIDKMGRKKLAYDVQGYRDGYFTTMIISVPAESISKFCSKPSSFTIFSKTIWAIGERHIFPKQTNKTFIIISSFNNKPIITLFTKKEKYWNTPI